MIVNPRDTLTEVVTQCACGRSPTGKCVGWHNLKNNLKDVFRNITKTIQNRNSK